MIEDCWGVPVETGSAGAVKAFEDAVIRFATLSGDPAEPLRASLRHDSQFLLGKCGLAYRSLYAMTEPSAEEASVHLSGLTEPGSSREAAHLSACRRWLEGDVRGAAQQLRAWARTCPRDLLAVKVAQDLYLFLGERASLWYSVEESVDEWKRPGRDASLIQGMRSFGLEENGQYAAAREAANEALEDNPANSYARHTLAHVCEMTAQYEAGVDLLRSSEEYWSRSTIRVHLWWHLTLFHIGLGDLAGAEKVLRTQMLENRPLPMRDIVDAVATLWRLRLGDCDVDPVARQLLPDMERFAGDLRSPFNVVHLVAGLALAGEMGRARHLTELVKGKGKVSSGPFALSGVVCEALVRFCEGEHEDTLSLLAPVRHHTFALGHSIAQLDLVDQTLIAAALASRPDLGAGAVTGRAPAPDTIPLGNWAER